VEKPSCRVEAKGNKKIVKPRFERIPHSLSGPFGSRGDLASEGDSGFAAPPRGGCAFSEALDERMDVQKRCQRQIDLFTNRDVYLSKQIEAAG
jgi:hypothetical protein